MKKFNSLLLCFAFAACLQVFYQNNLFAQAPVNDNCSGATLINTIAYNDLTTNYINASTVGATRSTPTLLVLPVVKCNDDIWYKFVAVTQTELLRVQTVVAG